VVDPRWRLFGYRVINVKERTFEQACVHCKSHALRSFCYFLSYGGESDGGNSKFECEVRRNKEKKPRSERGLSHGREIENIPLFS